VHCLTPFLFDFQLFDIEGQVGPEEELFIVAPKILLVACIITGPASLIERTSELILK
jgi:hypothetical protein